MNPGKKRNQRRAGFLSVLILLLAAPVSSLGQEAGRAQLTDQQKKKAKEHYDKATRFYHLGKYEDAIQEYENAYLISADPVMLYNIAQSHRLNNQPEEAIRFYRNYLRNAPNAQPSIRADVEKKITEMEKLAEENRRKAEASRTVSTPPPVTTPLPPTEVPPPVGPPSPPTAEVTAARPAPEPPRKSKVLPVTLLTGGGVLVATSVIFGAAAASKAKQVEEKAMSKTSTFDQSVKELETQGQTANTLAVLSGLVGVAAGVTGVILLVKPADAESRAGSAAGPLPARASLYPLVGPGLAGAGARLAF
jgi:tetratricopeptide (TPR) repeat protein